MNFNFSILTLAVLMLSSGNLFSQNPINSDQSSDERVSPLLCNPDIRHRLINATANELFKTTSVNDTLNLPFFDDFSSETCWPKATLWSDSTAYVNFGFCINPPSIGAVTFDGIDKDGNAYDDVNAGATGLCDVLTSLPIDLASDLNGVPYLTSDSLFLIFYYQRKGRGDKPETNDSLSLQFYNVVTQSWEYAWSVTGNSTGDTTFSKVKISINNPSYRQRGFKFRFRNHGSKNGMLDIWNVDYIYLNKFLPPDYEVIRDYSFVNQAYPLFSSYASIPWTHYNSINASQQSALLRPAAVLTVRNNNDPAPFPLSISGKVVDPFGNPTQLFGGGGSNSIIVPLNTNTNPPSAFAASSFFSNPSAFDQTYFDVVYALGQTSGGLPDDFAQNDTLIHRQHFFDYYSYDDGSAELAYGINGVNAKLAYRFDILKGDTLRGVNMFFAQSGTSVASQQFRLAVWSGNASGPQGNPVYEEFNQTPAYLDSINKFKTYKTDPIYLGPGTWYFGFIQNNAVLLNIGLDVNTPADPTKKYFNTSGSWTQSQLPGMWMIRPVFSGEELYSGIGTNQSSNQFTIYPNPATDHVRLNYPEDLGSNAIVEFLDATGRLVKSVNNRQDNIPLTDLNAGIYFVRLTYGDAGIIQVSRLVVKP